MAGRMNLMPLGRKDVRTAGKTAVLKEEQTGPAATAAKAPDSMSSSMLALTLGSKRS